jgi:hemerythrin-like metal-binding protein
LEAIVSLTTWDESYSVKVSQCDADHKKLFELINTLHNAMSERDRKAVVAQVIDELTDYATYHFATEEAMLEKTKYPQLASHRREHLIFTDEARRLQRDLAALKGGQALTVVVFLNDWLLNHIRQTDQRFSAHLNAGGIF